MCLFITCDVHLFNEDEMETVADQLEAGYRQWPLIVDKNIEIGILAPLVSFRVVDSAEHRMNSLPEGIGLRKFRVDHRSSRRRLDRLRFRVWLPLIENS